MAVSYSISGPSGGVIVPRNAAWETPAWSWSYWLKVPTSVSTNSPAVLGTSTSGNPTNAGFCTEMFGGGIYIDVNGTQNSLIGPADAWRHLVYAFDGTDFRVYLDGTLTFTFTPGAMVWGTGDLHIGGFNNTACLMKGVRIYNRKISLSEVGTLNAGGELTPGLLFDWRCNEGTGSTLTDSVAGLVGTSGSAITWSTDVPAANPDAPVVVVSSGRPRRRQGLSAARLARIAASFQLPRRD